MEASFEHLRNFFFKPRNFFLFVSVFCFSLLGVGFFLEYFVGLIPCQLCILQRVLFFLVGVTSAFFVFTASRWSFLVGGVLSSVFSLFGLLVAARHVFIQWIPQAPGTTCALPWFSSFSDVVVALTSASANCAERGWTLFFLSIPEWALVSFAFLLVSSLFFVFSVLSIKESSETDIDRI